MSTPPTTVNIARESRCDSQRRSIRSANYLMRSITASSFLDNWKGDCFDPCMPNVRSLHLLDPLTAVGAASAVAAVHRAHSMASRASTASGALVDEVKPPFAPSDQFRVNESTTP